MFIQTEQTPNPLSLKFIPGCEVMLRGTAEFTSGDGTDASPLAQKLFAITGITGVFFTTDFVTVTKDEQTDWNTLKTEVMGALVEHFATGQPVMADEHIAQDAHTASDDDDDVVKQIKEILDTRIRPAVAADGGDIVFHGFENGVVLLQMRGACAGCPSSTVTLKNGIENLLKHFIPEVNEVRAIN
ncbi:MAG: NifU family protein [Alphaproteobacteria bacterium]|nr:NifU family protein [Alphaproteobacteria bacterium]